MSIELSEGPADTEAIGARIAAGLGPGDVVLISGELGSGKTTLVRGAARGLGVTEAVLSPTFTIGRRYRGSVLVAHLDLFRLGDIRDEDPAMLEDYLTPEAVAFVEWPEAAARAPTPEGTRVAVRVDVRHAGGDRREVEILGPPAAER